MGGNVMYRCEHPKPQFMRENWMNLNGKWEFEFDFGNSGLAREMYKNEKEYSKVIEVPFCPESKLSGIEYKDFMNAVWYRREVEFTRDQLENRVILHFGAVDYIATVYVNEKKVGMHKGGSVSFQFDITDYLKSGKNTICVYAQDDTRSRLVPTGKQSDKLDSYGCLYTRITGIWQTVWMEFVPKTHIVKAKLTPDVDNVALNIEATLKGVARLEVEVRYKGRIVGKTEVESDGGIAYVHVPLEEKYLWEVGNGRLYDLYLEYGEDKVQSYFGLRSIKFDGYKFLLNGKSVFQRLVLDQGFYPDGIWTAPSDAELEADIDRSLAMGFNGARLHEKVFEERFLYYCDKKGYLVWGEYPNWGLDPSYADCIYGILPEWMEEIERDYNHPSIIGWCPFNETWDLNGRKQYDDAIRMVYRVTKAMDPTRPCIDSSGFFHVESDIFDVHDYEQDPEKFRDNYAGMLDGVVKDTIWNIKPLRDRQKYNGKDPFFVSEYGGIAWSASENGWGYGEGPKTEEEFLSRLKGLTDVLLDNPHMFGFCYTQLTDVEQEQNGLYTYDRKPKFDPKLIHKIFARKAAIEE